MKCSMFIERDVKGFWGGEGEKKNGVFVNCTSQQNERNLIESLTLFLTEIFFSASQSDDFKTMSL